MSILTLQDAKDQLQVTDSDHDAEIQRAAARAEDIIASTLQQAWDPTWESDPTTVPGEVYQAIVLTLTHYWVNRGEDLRDHDEKLTDAVDRLLAWRRPRTAV